MLKVKSSNPVLQRAFEAVAAEIARVEKLASKQVKAGLGLRAKVDSADEIILELAGKGSSQPPRPLQLRRAPEGKITIWPGTISVGDDEITVTEEFVPLSPPTETSDLLLVLTVSAASQPIQYLYNEGSPELTLYEAFGVASLVGYAFSWEVGGTAPTAKTRATINPETGEPDEDGVYWVKLGRAVVNGEGTVTSLTNYKFGHIAFTLCTGAEPKVWFAEQ